MDLYCECEGTREVNLINDKWICTECNKPLKIPESTQEDITILGEKLNRKQEILFIDATPDEEYPLRILEAYRANCDTKWVTDTDGNCSNPMFQQMNEDQNKRAELLNDAIKKLI